MPHVCTLQGEGSAAAAAEQLVAEEAQEAAKAAAKKAKKQKAKARKQQACSEATSPTEPAAALCPPTPEPVVTLHQTDPSESSASGSSPDKDSPSQQLQLQHGTAQDTAVHPSSVPAPQHDRGSSECREDETSPDPDPDATGQQPQLHHRTYTLEVNTALKEQVPSPATAAAEDDTGHGAHAANAATANASRGADASFLDQLFCCPITKVLDLLHLEGA